MKPRHHHSLIALGACMALSLCAGLGRAADAPAPGAPPAVEAPAEEKPRSFSMRIGGDEGDGTGERGIVISVDGDDVEGAERAERAARVVDRVVGDLEQALARLPAQARQEVDEESVRELREALGEIRALREQGHQTIDRIIAQGHEVPIELLDALDKGRSNGRSRLSRGTVNVALGAGIGAALFSLSGPDAATLGLIPLCIGIAQLFVWSLERNSPGRTA